MCETHRQFINQEIQKVLITYCVRGVLFHDTLARGQKTRCYSE